MSMPSHSFIVRISMYRHLCTKFLCFQNSLYVCAFLLLLWKILLKIIALANKVSIFVREKRQKSIILGNLWNLLNEAYSFIHSFHLIPMFASSSLVYCVFVGSFRPSFFSWPRRVVVFASWMKKIPLNCCLLWCRLRLGLVCLNALICLTAMRRGDAGMGMLTCFCKRGYILIAVCGGCEDYLLFGSYLDKWDKWNWAPINITCNLSATILRWWQYINYIFVFCNIFHLVSNLQNMGPKIFDRIPKIWEQGRRSANPLECV